MQLRNFSLCKFLWLLTLLVNQSVVAYVPKSLMNGSSPKYKTGLIDSGDFCYSYWMDTTMASNYGSTDAVRESFAPNAMVDTNGDLYAISLWGFGSSNGPNFAIHKYVNGSYSTEITFYPWTKIPGVTPNCTSTPSFNHSSFSGISVAEDTDKNYFKEYIHNAFMPCLAQEPDEGSDYLYGFVYIPTTRLMNIEVKTSQYSGAENGGTEGMLFFKIKKDGLSNLTTTYTPHTKYRCFQYNCLFPKWIKHKIDGKSFQPYYGNFMACYNSKNKNVHLYHGADLTQSRDTYSSSSPSICHSIFSENGTCNSCTSAHHEMWQYLKINLKLVKCGEYFYFMCTRDGYVPGLFMQSISSDSVCAKIGSLWSYLYLDNMGGTTQSRYDFDFLVLDAGDGKNKVWCILGFQGQNNYSGLTATQGWASTYCNFSYSNASLFIWSFPITNDTIEYVIEDPGQGIDFSDIDRGNSSGCIYAAYPEYIQNVIYTTECGSTSALKPRETGDKKKRLYLSTQKMCTYKNYIIYAYCYPGKSNGKGNHLYIGYVPYVISSNAQLRLLTKIEFKDENDDSFITDCSRIISLDCKNGHIWLTYTAKNSAGVENSYYKYFYIKASDLVGE